MIFKVPSNPNSPMISHSSLQQNKNKAECVKNSEMNTGHALVETTMNILIISVKYEIYRMSTNFKNKPPMTLSCALKAPLRRKAVNKMLILHFYCWAVERHLVLLINHPHCGRRS